MSNAALNHIWKHSRQSGGALVVMLAIADMANDEGDCWPGKSNLAEKCRMSERNLQKVLVKLQEAGELMVFYNDGIKTATGHTNRYRVIMDEYRGKPSDTPPVARGEPHDTPSESRGEPGDTPGANSTTPLKGSRGEPGDTPGANPVTPDPSVDPSTTNDPTDDPSTTTGEMLTPNTDVVDELELILPLVRKLGLDQPTQDRLLAQGDAYALAVAWGVEGPGVRYPAGLARHMMDNGGPPELALEQARLALEMKTVDRDAVDRELRSRELTEIWEQTQEFAAARESQEPPVVADKSPVTPVGSTDQPVVTDDNLDKKPPGSRLSWRDIWTATLGQLSLQLNRSTYVNWVQGTKALSFADGVLTVQARHGMAKEWLDQHSRVSIEDTLQMLAGQPVQIAVVAAPPLNVSQHARV